MSQSEADPPRLTFAGLTQALDHWAAIRPDTSAVILLGDGERETGRLTYAELVGGARALAGKLRAEGLAGRPMLVPAQTTLEFVKGFYAALMAGVVVVPVSTQARGSAAERLEAIALSCGADAVLDAPGADALCEVLPHARRIGMDAIGDHRVEAPGDGGRVALLQYTSGSTAEPRGVAITADNLARNAEQGRRAYRLGADSRGLSWLPLYHDMGLMSLMMPLWAGITIVLMPPLCFFQKPQRWPLAIDRFGATVSGGPNFAYNLCAARAKHAVDAGVDLSRWTYAFCGSEPVRRSTLRRFADAYAPTGFDPRSLHVSYGLAEATVFVSSGRWDTTVAEGPLSCGAASEDTTINIVDQASRAPVPDGESGEVWVRGPQVGVGYWNDPEATEATFHGRLSTSPDEAYLRTGDIGVLRDGELYVLGRIKDVFIERGVNVHAVDIEATASAADPAFLDAPGAAFGVERDDREAVILVQEAGRRFARPDDLGPLIMAVKLAVATDHALSLAEVLIVRPGSLPRTASGKVRRAEARRLYLEGAFETRRVEPVRAAADGSMEESEERG